MIFRLAKPREIDKIMKIYQKAREFMLDNGNTEQWGHLWPTEEHILKMINNKVHYLMIDDEERIIATFSMIRGIDPSYINIEGKWLNDNEYVAIHNVASSFLVKGVMHKIIKYALKTGLDIRMDTHKDNKIMKRVLEKEGFIYTGVIYVDNLENYSPRLAYQLINK